MSVGRHKTLSCSCRWARGPNIGSTIPPLSDERMRERERERERKRERERERKRRERDGLGALLHKRLVVLVWY